ncbi:hypothetical protein FIBSPDRAFT_923178 [Athelia psychrophila]|uniref:TIR domain-containing protein n=1 Tax=Athelia psychrophila TaxID=1759441 RepID=A0A167VT83_9AGAM|nr:hypothetical protein FIBSPDRAFT_923178 [Fibularhizoctonia sp. CBS 109695]
MANVEISSTKQPSSFHCIIFYRWYTDNGVRERGRVMARLVGELLKSMGVLVWLDQFAMSRDTRREDVCDHITEGFQKAQMVIILSAPGDWDRFLESDDIHRWEWEMSMNSDKPVWLLQYEMPQGAEILGLDLSGRLKAFSEWLASLASTRDIPIRTLTMDTVDSVLVEVAKRAKHTPEKPRLRRGNYQS